MMIILRIVLVMLMLLGIGGLAQAAYQSLAGPDRPTLVSIADVEAGQFPRERHWWRIEDGHLDWANVTDLRYGDATFMFIPYVSDRSMVMNEVRLFVRNSDPDNVPELSNAITAWTRAETFPVEGMAYPAITLPEALTAAYPGIEQRVFVLDYGTSPAPRVAAIIVAAILTVPGIVMIIFWWRTTSRSSVPHATSPADGDGT